MKLRSIICVSAVVAAATASALTTTNTFARLPVTANYTNTIIALPFSGCGMAEGSIYVTNLVMTANLENGDTLLYKNSSGDWFAWEIAGAPGNAHWTSIASGTKGGVSVSPHPANFTLPCGEACWLNRNTPSNKFYLYGQVNAAKTDVSVPAGTSSAVTYTIIGCPYEAGPFNVKSINGSSGDTVILMANNKAGSVKYTYTNNAWRVWSKTAEASGSPFASGYTPATYDWVVPDDAAATVPAGCGFMYGRKATSPLTINWGD